MTLMLRLGPATAAIGLALLATAAPAAQVTVEVRNVESGAGRVFVALCTPETFLQPVCPYGAGADASPGGTVVIVRGVPAGTYAVQAFHDADGDRIVGRNLLGLPTEGIGFGNDAPLRWGPPDFAEAAVIVAEPATETSLRLRYFSRP